MTPMTIPATTTIPTTIPIPAVVITIIGLHISSVWTSCNETTRLAYYKPCFFEENFEPNWIQIKVKPSSFNHSRNKIIDFCNRMKDQVAVDIFPLKKSLPKDNFVRVYREFKNKMMRGVNDIFYDIIKKFRVVHESALYEYYRIHEPILHDRNYTKFLLTFNRTTNKHIIKEIRVMAYDLRETIYKEFDSMDDEFLAYYYNIPCNYNMYLNYSNNLDFYQINKSTAAKRRRIWRDYDGDHSRLK
ncbi:hypothetical protein M8J75_007081 [Diaphorina citri]|nr:hypothetical protein M8J75_007081 [Diaphorina citri]KAI5728963.1 hypothetical protein M8J77_023717 [Diaphorina citri]